MTEPTTGRTAAMSETPQAKTWIVYFTGTATFGVPVTALTAEEAEVKAESSYCGPISRDGIDFTDWQIAAGQTEDPAVQWMPEHVRAKRHAQWVRAQLAQREARP
jgi:hypothetical protein